MLVEANDKYLWLFEEVRQNFIFSGFVLVGLTVLIAYLVYKYKNKNMPRQIRRVIGPRRIVLGIAIYLMIIMVFTFFYLFQMYTNFDIAAMGFEIWIIRYFELAVLPIILLVANTVIIAKTDWYSKKL